MGITKRNFLKGSAAIAAGVALTKTASAKPADLPK